MVYLLETKLIEKTSVCFALFKIYGIGKSKSFKLSKQLGFSRNLKVKDLSPEQISKLLLLIETSNLILTSDLKKLNILVLKTHVTIKSYRGLRKIRGLPSKGQRTHTNARTARKKRL